MGNKKRGKNKAQTQSGYDVLAQQESLRVQEDASAMHQAMDNEFDEYGVSSLSTLRFMKSNFYILLTA
ncbi:MAG: hypothetical protein O3B09_02705, partial [Proteobacteria bacterium]|nr:hypothetical protein [Pseudomonadota bacterium]